MQVPPRSTPTGPRRHWIFNTTMHVAPTLVAVGEVGFGLAGRVNRPDLLAAATGAMAVTGAAINLWRGQPAWCFCNTLRPGTLGVLSEHTSQHWVDPYSLSHMLHGVLMHGALSLIPRLPLAAKALATAAAAVGWEVLENSPTVIDRYRRTTIARDYDGDTVANSMSDIAACMAGFLFASNVSGGTSLAVFLGVEIGMAAIWRDCLTLDTLMLLHPIKAIRDWQNRRPTWA